MNLQELNWGNWFVQTWTEPARSGFSWISFIRNGPLMEPLLILPATSIYQSHTTSPSQTACINQYYSHKHTHLRISKYTHHYTNICRHHGIHSDDFKWTYQDPRTFNYQVCFVQETQRNHTVANLLPTDNCTYYLTKVHFQVHCHVHSQLHPYLQ